MLNIKLANILQV